MTATIGYDAIHLNVSSVPQLAAVVCGYDTGTPNIRWTPQDWSRFHTSRLVHIDQGGIGSPIPTATVRDVETGAWTPESAVAETGNWHALRRTIYCNQNTLPRVLAAGWQGDLWLAILSDRPPASPPVVKGCNVVAVQFAFDTTYDRSVVFDPYWPERHPAMPGVLFAAPNNLAETATVTVKWDAVAPVEARTPTGYTVAALGLDGKEYFHTVTDATECAVTGLTKGWTYNIHVWANGGDDAPPHASLTVHV